MAYSISWHTENHIILVELSGVVSEGELTAITEESFELVKQTTHRIHAIVDQSNVDSMPRSLKVLSSSIPRNRSQNQGITVLVVPDMNKFARFMASTFMQIIGLEYRVVSTRQEAEEILMGLRHY